MVPLLPGTRYVIRRPTDRYFVVRLNQSLGKCLLQRMPVRAEFIAGPERDFNDAGSFAVGRIWTGRLTSNVLNAR